MSDAKEQLIRAGERLFAREGIHRARVKELNELAGQRNVSALHYHFGSREGLLAAIVQRHSGEVDADRAQRLLAAGAGATLRQLVTVIVAPLAEELGSTSGRDYLRIVPQLLDSDISPPALMETIDRAAPALALLPEEIRRDRIASMILAMTTILAARAAAEERGESPVLGQDRFVENLIDMATAMLQAPAA